MSPTRARSTTLGCLLALTTLVPHGTDHGDENLPVALPAPPMHAPVGAAPLDPRTTHLSLDARRWLVPWLPKEPREVLAPTRGAR